MSHERLKTGFVATSAVLVVGCGGPDMSPGTIGIEDIRTSSSIVKITPGESATLPVLRAEENPVWYASMVNGLPLIDYQYPRKADDAKNPSIMPYPTREITRVTLQGEGAALANDMSCDFIKLDTTGFKPESMYIGAIALGDNEANRTTLSWNKDAKGNPEGFIQLCSEQENEPKDGAVLFVSDRRT